MNPSVPLHPSLRLPVGLLLALIFPLAGRAVPVLPGHAEPGSGAKTDDIPAHVAAPSPLPAASKYDLLVYGATPGGVACAVRAAREGLSVLLVDPTLHAGGLFSQGLSVMDTLYAGSRAPIYDELRRAIHDYYRTTYGPDSAQFAASRPGHPKAYFEARIIEHLINQMLARERGITLVLGFYPIKADMSGGMIGAIGFRERHGERRFGAQAAVFADCSYEADLAVLAGAHYRVGREGRDEFNEEHAGRIFLRKVTPFPPPNVDPAIIAEYKKLNLFHYDRWFEIMRPESTGQGDRQVQTYNIRSVLTTDPANRYIPAEPPPGYDAAASREIWNQKPPYSQLLGPLPNQKYLWNMPEVIGPQNDYPDGDWRVRERVVELHRRATLGMLYFLQNDPSLPEETRSQWRNLGFARDEFTDSGHLPAEVYARETRRVMARRVFTENDVRLAPGLGRTPVQADSIGVTEWFVDSHASGTERIKDSIYEGEIYLNYISHPGQVPYRAILPEGFENLLVPVCLSATHVGWGAIRLEPTWMGLGESAAHAAVMAVEQGAAPARIDPAALVRRLAAHHVLISFFNDVDVAAGEDWVGSVELLGTQGYFTTYDARPFDLLGAPLATAWIQAAVEWRQGKRVDLDERARGLRVAERAAGPSSVTAAEFIDQLTQALAKASLPSASKQLNAIAGPFLHHPLTRGQACRLICAISAP